MKVNSKKKNSLPQLAIKSFVTDNSKIELDTIKGGSRQWTNSDCASLMV